MTVYLDVLVLLNLYVCYFLFLGTARLLSIRLKPWRLFLGSLLGGLYALSFLLECGPGLLALLKTGMGVSLVLLVFYTPRLAALCRRAAAFLLVNVLFGGLMAAVWFTLSPDGMLCRNGVVYFDISALTLALATVGAYLFLLLVSFLKKRQPHPAALAALTVGLGGKTVTLQAFLDTGNRLSDLFTGLPVAVCEYDAVAALLPPALRDYCRDPFASPPASGELTGIRLLPVRLLAGEALLPIFRPDSLLVNGRERDGMVAVTGSALSTGGSCHAILHPDLLS